MQLQQWSPKRKYNTSAVISASICNSFFAFNSCSQLASVLTSISPGPVTSCCYCCCCRCCCCSVQMELEEEAARTNSAQEGMADEEVGQSAGAVELELRSGKVPLSTGASVTDGPSASTVAEASPFQAQRGDLALPGLPKSILCVALVYCISVCVLYLLLL